jgi:hypothetical protein
MMTKLFMLCATMMALLATGCLSVDYQGKSYAPTENVKFYSTAKEVPQPFDVMGKAICSGNYVNTTKEDIVKELISQAEAKGADAVLLHEYAIVVTGSLREHQLLTLDGEDKLWEESGHALSDWSKLEEDFAVNYGTIGKKNSKKSPSTNSYRRIIQVEFLKFKPATK